MAPEIIDLTNSSPHPAPAILVDSSSASAAQESSAAQNDQTNKKKRKRRTKRASLATAEDGEIVKTSAETSREQSEGKYGDESGRASRNMTPRKDVRRSDQSTRDGKQPQSTRKSLLERIEGAADQLAPTPEEGEINGSDEEGQLDDGESGLKNGVEPPPEAGPSRKKKKRSKKRNKAEDEQPLQATGHIQETESARERERGPRREREDREDGTTRDRDRERERDDQKDCDYNRKRRRDREEDRDEDKSYTRNHDRDRDRRRTSPRRRSHSPDLSRREKKSTQSTSDTADLFFIDTDKIEVPASAAPSGSRANNSDSAAAAGKPDGLLLPAHVLVAGEGEDEAAEILPPSGDEMSEDEDFIEFLAYDDDRKTPGMVRYFDTVDENAKPPKPKKFICKKCGAEGEHKTYECPVMICLTCGARDEHPTRSCPISKTCFTCGMKGHINSTCPNRYSNKSSAMSNTGCDRCGSQRHKINECPTLWRIYQYVDDAEQKVILDAREQLSNVPLGEGGEGYIATDVWCYNCGGCGHLGDDCKDRPHPYDFPRESSAFSVYNLLSGPFSETYDRAAPARAPREWETADAFADGFGFEAPLHVGKNARRKERMRLEQHARDAEDAGDDEDDWFSRANGARQQPPNRDRNATPRKPAMKVGAFSDGSRFSQRGDSRKPNSRSDYNDFPGPARETDSIQVRGAARRQDSRHYDSRYGRESSSGRRDRGPRYHGGYSR